MEDYSFDPHWLTVDAVKQLRVDRNDLLLEVIAEAKKRNAALLAKSESVVLSAREHKEQKAIAQRLTKLAQSPKAIEYTIDYMCKDFDARLYKPQRLVSLSYEEEEKRALEGWWWFDWMLNLACFRQRGWKQTCSIFLACVFFLTPRSFLIASTSFCPAHPLTPIHTHNTLPA